MGSEKAIIPYFKHFVIEINCLPGVASSLKWLRESSELLLDTIGVKIIKEIHHNFKPQGISILYILSSSHMALHSWPEHEYLHIDLIICSRANTTGNVEFALRSTFPGFNYKLNELKYPSNF